MKKTAKQIFAATKNILTFEAKQAEANRTSNDKEVFAQGMAFGMRLIKHRHFLSGIVVGGSVELVFDGLAAGLVADGQAVDAVFDKLTVFGLMIRASSGPLAMVLGVEGGEFRRAGERTVGVSLRGLEQ